MSNSIPDPVRAFFKQFRRLWRSGRGRGVLVGKRLGHVADEQWNAPEFADALGKAGAAGKDEMVGRWRDGKNVPRRPQMDAILRVLFTVKDAAGRPTFDPAATECEAFHALWAKAHAARQSRARRAEPPRSNQPDDWWLEGGHEFPDLVTFRTFQPTPLDRRTDHYDVPASLTFAMAEPEDPDDGGIRIAISLLSAWLEIPATSYQQSPDLMVGDPGRPHANVERIGGRYKIVRPALHDYLDGDTFSNETVATVEPAQRRGGPLALRITAPMTDIIAVGRTVVDGVAADVTRDQSQVLKLLLKKGCRIDEGTGRAILAERLLTRKAARK